MPLLINGLQCSIYHGQVAYALKLYAKAPDNAVLSDETIGCIIGFLRAGLGSHPIPYHDLVTTFQQSHPADFATVTDDSTYWGTKARQLYRRWMDANAQAVKRLNGQGRISAYLDTGASSTERE
ncbi:hypothetical protein JMJ35_007336 [Cladonia borealis]|uniref:Uncharacterized protein n=1 Tax=Cladonia borealis TaxID=184061 RepID=A0AA39QVE6_9LECA|nr:hypothetical protein JMJ35_007336 [Cladonia borealis]